MGAVVDQVARLVDNGYLEVVITGVDATSYGADLPGRPSLGRLVRTILDRVPELARIRLSSIDSIEADEHLMRLIAEEPRFMPHLHLSLQHGDDMILKRMKRRHLRADAVRFCEEVRALRPDIAFGADIIAGFPTETEAMFENALSIVDECGLSHLHVFPYSPREGTPAARMPQHDRALIKERAARLREKGEEAWRAHLDTMVGRAEALLIEKPGFGRTENFAPVRLPDGIGAAGTLVPAAITGHNGAALTGALDAAEARTAA
jgi:threonylcarbamoyladenosine tRNA methylthiotransferase MtaB